jgi:hypothetical protein
MTKCKISKSSPSSQNLLNMQNTLELLICQSITQLLSEKIENSEIQILVIFTKMRSNRNMGKNKEIEKNKSFGKFTKSSKK